jgi:hypothetical protein
LGLLHPIPYEEEGKGELSSPGEGTWHLEREGTEAEGQRWPGLCAHSTDPLARPSRFPFLSYGIGQSWEEQGVGNAVMQRPLTSWTVLEQVCPQTLGADDFILKRQKE